MSSFKQLLAKTGQFYEVMHYDDNNGTKDLYTTTHEDIDGVAQMAREIRDGANWALTNKEPMRHVAVIPKFVLDRSLRERWDEEDWKRWANNPDNAIFRTWPGAI